MFGQRILMILVLFGAALGIAALTAPDACVQAQEKKKTKDPREGKRGKTIGTLTAVEKNAIEVKADGEEKARRYVPHWKNLKVGFDPEMVKIFSTLKVGSRLEVEWVFEERFRAEKITVLKQAK